MAVQKFVSRCWLFFFSALGYSILALLVNAFKVPSVFEFFTDNQSLYWIYFDLYSTGPVWFLLLLEVFAAILPDIVIKVLENLRDTELIRKEKRDEQSRIDRAKNNLRNKTNGSNFEIGNIEGFHRNSAGPSRGQNNDLISKPVDNSFSVRKDKIHMSDITPMFNNNANSNKRFKEKNLSDPNAYEMVHYF